MSYTYVYKDDLGNVRSIELPDNVMPDGTIRKPASKKKKITIKVKCKTDATVYVIDRQALIKTYISRIVLKQWFTSEGKKKTKTTYCIPDDEVGEQSEKTKFVAGDFGKIIFTSYKSAAKKFKKLSKYKRNNDPTGEGYIEDDSNIPDPTEEDPILDEVEVEEETSEDDTESNGYIKVDPDSDSKDDTPNRYQDPSGSGPSYYDSTGKKVYPNSDGTINGAKGDVIKVNYYDSDGNTIIHNGKYLGKGTYVYEDGKIVPKDVKILRYMELYGNASIKDGIQIQPDKYGEVPENIDVEDLDTDVDE